ncbi:MAG: hypothetical protein IKT60_05410, partial [Clostridia bacterium]|nr:hypothetical protein [Clostridia bacterium]
MCGRVLNLSFAQVRATQIAQLLSSFRKPSGAICRRLCLPTFPASKKSTLSGAFLLAGMAGF